MITLILSLVTLLVAGTLVMAETQVATLRGSTDLTAEPTPPIMQQAENKDLKRERAYPQQPPTIPHKIDGYQVDLNFNKCLSCHNRKTAEKSQAPMVSITHFQNREGQFLIDVTPARYFCNQCHVPQLDAILLVENMFIDMDTLVTQGK